MDLSSLEGPPIPDSRFTITYHHHHHQNRDTIPSIHLDLDADFPGARTSASSRLNHKYHDHRSIDQAQTQAPPRRRRSSFNEDTSNNSPLLAPGPTRGSGSGNGFWTRRSRSSSNTETSNSRRQHRLRGTASNPTLPGPQNTGERLVWLEEEVFWVLVEGYYSSEAEPSSSSSGNINAASTPASTLAPTRGRAWTRQPSLSHSRSTESGMRRLNAVPDVDQEDPSNGGSPPPYGDHFYDPIVAARPMQPSRGQGLSRWGAIARRVNRVE